MISNSYSFCALAYHVVAFFEYNVDLRLLSFIKQDDLDDVEMKKMEEARQAYVAAVAAAKAKQDEESIAAAATARLHLQSFVFRT